MELIDNLNRSSWRTADPSKQEGYITMRIFRYLPKEAPDRYMYAMFDMEGNLYKVDIQGGDEKYDPLKGLSTLNCKITEDKHHIIGICLEDDCVEFSGTIVDYPES